MIARAADADVVVKASGVGIFDDLLLEVWQAARSGALKIFWDVDAHATLAELAAQPDHPLRRSLPDLDPVLTYGGGPPVVSAYRALGTQRCAAIHPALEHATRHPLAQGPAFASAYSFLG